jgi:superfamily II DNA or RNA helicase
MRKKISPKNKIKLDKKEQIKENEKLENNKVLEKIEHLKKNNLLNSYLGNKGYSIYKVCLTNDIITYIKKELTVKPFTQNSIVESVPFPVYQESDKKIYVPRFWGLKVFGKPNQVKITQGKSINIEFKGQLRKEPVNQEEIVDAYLNSLKTQESNYSSGGSCLIELKCGGGKTILALNILSKLKKKTIIFVQKTFLKNQWIERIEEFLPDAKVGTIQGQIIDIENKDIVIAMVQSISMKSYPESLFDDFGFTIFDETHHMASNVFCNCLKKCNTLYSLGLSGTMNRKDGLTFVFKMYLGEICFKTKEDNGENNVLVKAIDYHVLDDDEYNEVERDFRGNIKHTTLVSKVAKYEYRADFILNVMINEIKINPKQQIILLSQTKNLLNYLYKLITLKNVTSVGYYIGGMKEKDLKESESKQIILATFAMAAEALDIKSLTTLVLATPKSDIVQAVGRIMRAEHSQPLIIDIIDQHEPLLNQFNRRRSFYNEKNYKIIRTTNTNYIEYSKEVNKLLKEEDIINCENNDLLINSYWKTLVYKPRKNTTQSKILNVSTKHIDEPLCLI